MRTVVSYWAGQIPSVARLHFASFRHFAPDWDYILFLDTDFPSPQSESEVRAICGENVVIRPFSLSSLLKDLGLPELHPPIRSNFRRVVAKAERRVIGAFHSLTQGRFSSHETTVGGSRAGWHPRFGYSPGHTVAGSDMFEDLPGRSDLFRCVIGAQFLDVDLCYVDLDICLTRNLRDFLAGEALAYRWEDFANTAFLYLPSSARQARMQLSDSIRDGLSPKPWVMFTDARCKRMGINQLGVQLFDPCWNPNSIGCGDSLLFFEKHESSEEFYLEVLERNFAVHWHNNWNTEVQSGSTYSMLESLFGLNAKRYPS